MKRYLEYVLSWQLLHYHNSSLLVKGTYNSVNFSYSYSGSIYYNSSRYIIVSVAYAG